MSKIIMFNMATLDSFFAGPNGEIDWHHVDEEFNDFAIAQLDSAAGLVFGRATYEIMAAYWPTPIARSNDPEVTDKMNAIPKLVVSTTLDKADWSNTRLVKENVAEEFSKLRRSPGKDWLLFGSANLAATLTDLGLLDEYRVMVNPVILGNGIPLFQGLKRKLDLKLTSTRVFRNGNVLLCYEPATK